MPSEEPVADLPLVDEGDARGVPHGAVAVASVWPFRTPRSR